MEQHTGGLTSDPVLERDSGLSSNTILPAYSPLRLPAAPHNKAHCWVSLARKAPWSVDCHPEVFHHFFPSLPPAVVEREEKLNNREDTRGTMVFRGHLNPQQTVSTSVGSG